jgi:hypothetical protein
MIVTAKPPKRLPPRKQARAQAANSPPMKVVTAKNPGRWKHAKVPVVDDPEADARVAAFLNRMVRPR